MTDLPELAVYVLTALVGVAAGIAFAAPAGAYRVLGSVSGLLTTVAVVVVAFSVADQAPWIGPVYALVSVLTTLLVSASVQGGEPGLLGEPYGRRIVLLAFHRRRLASLRASASDPVDEPVTAR